MGRLFARIDLRVRQHVRLRVMAFVTIADTGIISYISTKNLAERWGFGSLSWLYPLCLDAVAAVGMDLWMSNSPAKRAAAWLSLFAVGLSLAANVADWLYVGVGAAVLGAVPPLMLAALLLTLHFHAARTEHAEAQIDATGTGTDTVVPVPVTGTGRDDRPRQEETAHTTAEPATEKPAPVKPARPPARAARRPRRGPQPQVPDHEVIAALRARERNGEPVSRRSAMAEFNMGTPRAARLMAAAANNATNNNATNNGAQLNITDIQEDNS